MEDADASVHSGDEMNQTRQPVSRSSKKAPDSADEADAAPDTGKRRARNTGVGRRKVKSSNVETNAARTNVTSLGGLEAEVMGMLWEIGKPASSMDVAEKLLYKRRDKNEEPASFATVTTTLRRLAEKGVLTNSKSSVSRTQLYAPTVGREDMAARILNNVSVALLGQPLHGLLPKLVGGWRRSTGTADEAEQAEIARLMQALEEEAHIPAVSGGDEEV